MKAVSYLRVSTLAQGRSGLGLEAQRQAVEDLARSRGLTITAEFVEVESGKINVRQNLAAALRHSKMTGAVLVIAKLDRLSRNSAFLLTLRDSGVRFLAADVPDANDLTIGILAVIAQAEREAISKRTIEALGAAKARIEREGAHVSKRSGRIVTRLGNPRGAEAFGAVSGLPAAATAVAKRIELQTEALRPIITSMQEDGITTPTSLTTALNERGILSSRSGKWYPSTVASLLRRLGPSPSQAVPPSISMP